MVTVPRALLAFFVLAPLAIACGGHAASAQAPHRSASAPGSRVIARTVGARPFHLAKELPAGATLEIRSFNGPITAAKADDGTAIVDGERIAEADGDVSFRIVAVEHPGGLLVCALYPEQDDADCAPGGDGDGAHARGGLERRGATRFTVRVPPGARFVARTMNGAITADGLASDVQVLTMNGAIHVRAAGTVEARTMNGRIDAVVDAPPSGPLDFSTMNGDVAVHLPPSLDADVEVSTMRGDIDADFPLEERTGDGPSSARGRIGRGGPTLRASTMNGDVTLRRAR